MMDLKSLLENSERPSIFRGEISRISETSLVIHSKECSLAIGKVELPESSFRLTGCPLCGNGKELLAALSDIKSFNASLDYELNALREIQAEEEDEYKLFSLAHSRVRLDPAWFAEKPYWLPRSRRNECSDLDLFLVKTWHSRVSSSFSSSPFSSQSSRGKRVVLAPSVVISSILPEVVVSRTPLLQVGRMDAARVLVRVSQRESEKFKESSDYRKKGEIFYGRFEPSLLDNSFPELWELALELLGNDPSMSVNQALLSARLVAAPEPISR